MNDSEQFDAAPDFESSRPENSEAQFESFQKLFFATLVALLILSLSWNLFLIRQTGFVRRDLKTVRPQIGQLVANYQKTEDPEIKRFINALVAFGRTHPDFNPILVKYKIPLTPAPAAPAGTPPATSTNKK